MTDVVQSAVPDELGTHQTTAFLNLAFPPPRPFAIRLWDGYTLPAEADPSFTLTLRSPGSLRRMFRIPIELSLGEAYLHGDFDIEGDLAAAFALPDRARALARSAATISALILRWLQLPRGSSSEELTTRGPALLAGEEHSLGRDRAAIQYHYDVGNDFYQLFLDRRMIYSCGYFADRDNDIDTAQEAKLEHLCRKLRLRPGERLLDIGCGWGGLLIHAAQHHGIDGLGVTLSTEQHRLATEHVAQAGLARHVRIEQRDYRELDDVAFDKIVSVGMFEHVGREHFAEYFDQAFRLLRPGGIFVNHAITARQETRASRPALVGRALTQLLVGNETFRRRYIFPDGELAPVTIANNQAEQAGFEIRDVENLREHYALTLRLWLDRLRANRAAAIRNAGLPIFRLWEMYLAGSIFHFETGKLAINQTVFCKPDHGRATLPLTRADLYASNSARPDYLSVTRGSAARAHARDCRPPVA